MPTPTSKGQSGDPLSRMFDILRHPHRRRILSELHQSNPRYRRDFVAGEVSIDDEDPELLDRLLYHTHLPMLAEAGYIDWNRETSTIKRGAKFDEIAPLIELMANHGDELPAGWP